MRPFRLLTALAALTPLGACQDPTIKPAIDVAAPTSDAMAVVEGYLAGLNAHDPALAASYLTNDVVYFDASVGVNRITRDAVQEKVIEAFFTAVPDCQWTRDTTRPVITPDGIAYQWTLSGTNTGPFADGTKPTGKHFSFKGATILRLRGDKVAYEGVYYDAYGFLKQLGLVL
jgi:predicted ester cyclase